ncbi:MAG: DinB family protein [Flavobacteriaceae bacterium]|nr:DinB family protein [Flavobacteriaceae bacterium]
MITTSLSNLFSRDLDRLKAEVTSYESDRVFWSVAKEISNSAGNLTIHLIGNLNHFIGAILGNTGYLRDREAEFNDKNIKRKLLLEQIDEIKAIIETTLSGLSDTDLQQTYPINIRKEGMSVEQFLLHLYGHLNYHLGQINYHRRLINEC